MRHAIDTRRRRTWCRAAAFRVLEAARTLCPYFEKAGSCSPGLAGAPDHAVRLPFSPYVASAALARSSARRSIVAIARAVELPEASSAAAPGRLLLAMRCWWRERLAHAVLRAALDRLQALLHDHVNHAMPIMAAMPTMRGGGGDASTNPVAQIGLSQP